jgi:cellulose synthase/poly-beta-1,6-N-acetylglucosamine synthase-like glycosyltransferase
VPDQSSNAAAELTSLPSGVSAIVPARNEEEVIAVCLESLLLQPEITEILVVNDQSTDKTADVVRRLMIGNPRLRLLETQDLPPGWVGKNNAVAVGARQAAGAWLLFTDADAVHETGAAARALRLAQEHSAGLVSFSPEQITQKWYEKALIPFVYCRLARQFSFDAVNDPGSSAAAANGQFLMIRREAYEAIGGHAGVAGEVLEDLALAQRAKAAGYRLWFAPGIGIVRVRMYRSFGAMWQGWKKNLYRLMGGTPWAVFREMESVFPWMPFLFLLAGIKYPILLLCGVWLIIFRQMSYGAELRRNQFSFRLILYYVPAVVLYAGVLWASYRAYARGKVEWKGREVAVGVANKNFQASETP